MSPITERDLKDNLRGENCNKIKKYICVYKYMYFILFFANKPTDFIVYLLQYVVL